MSKAPPPIPPKPNLNNQTPPPAASTQLPTKSACSSSPIPPPRPSTSNSSPIRSQVSQSTTPPIIPPRPKPTPTPSSNVSSSSSSSSSNVSSSLSSSPTRSMPPPPAVPASTEINSNESRTSLVSVFSSLFLSSSLAPSVPTKGQTTANVLTSPCTPPVVTSRPAKSPSISTSMPSYNSGAIISSVSESAQPSLPPRIPPKPNNTSASSSSGSLNNSRNTSKSNSPITKSSPINATIYNATTAVISSSSSHQHDYEEHYAGSEHIDDTFYGDDFTAATATNAANNSKDSGGKLKPMVTPVKVEKKNVNVLSTIALTAEYQKPATVDMIREGVLTKIDSHGNEVMYHFTLTNTMLVYTEFVNIGNPDKLRVYEVTKLMAFENEEDYDDDPLSFRLLTKEKSWRMRCTTIKEKQDWFIDIVKIASEKQQAEPGIGRVWREVDLAPLFEQKGSVSACQLCQRGFGFMGLGAARHHCRNCGKVVCDLCSRERVRIERLDDRALMKVCSTCARELKNTRKYGK